MIFPQRCAICREFLGKEKEFICSKCMESSEIIKIMPKLPKIELVDDKIAAAFYEGKIRAAIHRFKYSGKSAYGKAFAREIYKQYVLENLKYDIVTYVPSNRYTVFKRGYNQAKVLAKEFSKASKIPLKRLITKNRNTKPMYNLSDSQRRANVLGAYKLCKDKIGRASCRERVLRLV